MKLKEIYICQSCQHQESNWIGKCPSCNAWNSFIEDVVESASKSTISRTPSKFVGEANKAFKLNEIITNQEKIFTNIEEFDRVAGNGITPGSLTLLSGEPGIGKSTLTLQIAAKVSESNQVLLISGEESIEQIAKRASRLNIQNENLQLVNEFNLENILTIINKQKPKLAIIDSIQVISSYEITSTAGSISQIRYCTEQIMELAKSKNITIILIGHVTKEGNLAGPRVLEHLVDTVMQLEGDRFQEFRILRAAKNRFGSCSEVGIFQMNEEGLQEVRNPSEQFLEDHRSQAIGSAITATIEGTRPLLIEVQALTNTTNFGYPKRTANGFDLNRLQILIAVLERYAGVNLQNQDVFVNVVGGMKLREPATDLAVLAAIASSFFRKALPEKAVLFGEVGLSGEIRKINHLEKRIKESEKMGLENIFSPNNLKTIKDLVQKIK